MAELEAASMRPRVFPAEDELCSPEDGGSATGFNEAAGIPRGRLTLQSVAGFNQFMLQ